MDNLGKYLEKVENLKGLNNVLMVSLNTMAYLIHKWGKIKQNVLIQSSHDKVKLMSLGKISKEYITANLSDKVNKHQRCSAKMSP